MIKYIIKWNDTIEPIEVVKEREKRHRIRDMQGHEREVVETLYATEAEAWQIVADKAEEARKYRQEDANREEKKRDAALARVAELRAKS